MQWARSAQPAADLCAAQCRHPRDRQDGPDAALIPWLRGWRQRGASIAGICTGVGLLAEAGFLEGRPATTHWAIVAECRRRYPSVHWQPERFITESDALYCSGGLDASIDMSIYLVEKYCGSSTSSPRALPQLWRERRPSATSHGCRQMAQRRRGAQRRPAPRLVSPIATALTQGRSLQAVDSRLPPGTGDTQAPRCHSTSNDGAG